MHTTNVRCTARWLRKPCWSFHSCPQSIQGRPQLQHNGSHRRKSTAQQQDMLLSFTGHRLDLPTTLTATAIPPTGRRLGQRVEHLVVTELGWLTDIVADAVKLPKSFILELIHFGAVYYCPISPAPRDTSPPEHAERIAGLRQAGIAKLGKDPALWTPKRVVADMLLDFPGGYLRVHVHPKRFPAAYQVDWSQRIIADCEEFVVVNKPAGVQVPSTVDNVLESMQACVEKALDVPPGSLKCTHRLDGCTEGVVVLGKTTGFARYFMNLLANKATSLRKIYRALAVGPPPLGTHIHYLKVDQRGPGDSPHSQVVTADTEGAKIAELQVLQVELVALTGAAQSTWGAHAYEVTILLKTGRTHQIRAQLAAVGCPLLGEALYVHPSAAMTARPPPPNSKPTPEFNSTLDLNPTPELDSNPELKATPELNPTPDVNATPELNPTPVMNVTPELNPALDLNPTNEFNHPAKSNAMFQKSHFPASDDFTSCGKIVEANGHLPAATGSTNDVPNSDQNFGVGLSPSSTDQRPSSTNLNSSSHATSSDQLKHSGQQSLDISVGGMSWGAVQNVVKDVGSEGEPAPEYSTSSQVPIAGAKDPGAKATTELSHHSATCLAIRPAAESPSAEVVDVNTCGTPPCLPPDTVSVPSEVPLPVILTPALPVASTPNINGSVIHDFGTAVQHSENAGDADTPTAGKVDKSGQAETGNGALFGAMHGMGHVAPEELLKPLGLQAFRLEILDEGGPFGPPPAVFEAGTPWWRR